MWFMIIRMGNKLQYRKEINTCAQKCIICLCSCLYLIYYAYTTPCIIITLCWDLLSNSAVQAFWMELDLAVVMNWSGTQVYVRVWRKSSMWYKYAYHNINKYTGKASTGKESDTKDHNKRYISHQIQRGGKVKWALHAAGRHTEKIQGLWGQLRKVLCKCSIPVQFWMNVNSCIRKEERLGQSALQRQISI